MCLRIKGQVKVKLFSHVSLFATPGTLAYQVPLSMGFSRQEYWSGLPFPSPGDLPGPGIEARSPTSQADALPSELPMEVHWLVGINLQQGFCHKPYEVIMETEQDSSLASCRACHSFTQAHYRVSKVQHKTCPLGEQRTRAPSILTLS